MNPKTSISIIAAFIIIAIGAGACADLEQPALAPTAKPNQTESKPPQPSPTNSQDKPQAPTQKPTVEITDPKKTYASFGININDYYDHNLSAETVSRLIDIYAKYNIKADLYFTEPVLKSYEKYHPELIKKIKDSKMSINYHFRPPHPAYDMIVNRANDNGRCKTLSELSFDDKKRVLSNFEKYELNVADYSISQKDFCSSYNNQKTGGYKYVASVFGANPIISAVSNIKDPDIKKAEAEVLKEMGTKMLVVEHFGNTKDSLDTPFEVSYGLPDRPSDFGLSFADVPQDQSAALKKAASDGSSFLSQANQAKGLKLNRSSFGVFIVHDYTFYNSKSWDLPLKDRSSLLRTEEDKEKLFKYYEEAVKTIVADSNVKVVSADQISDLYEKSKSGTNTDKNSGAAFPAGTKTPGSNSNTKLYIQLVIHVEDGYMRDANGNLIKSSRAVDYEDKTQFLHFSKAMRELAKVFQKHGAKINFQPDWTFIEGVKKLDPSFFTDLESMGHEIDSHSHEMKYKYEEIFDLLKSAGAHPSAVVGGFTPNNSGYWSTRFNSLYDKFKILWGAATLQHKEDAIQPGYVYRPKATNWLEHDPNQKLVYIGGGLGPSWVNNGTTLSEGGRNSVDTTLANMDSKKLNDYSLMDMTADFFADAGTSGIPSQFTAPNGNSRDWKTRINVWDKWLSEKADPLVKEGKIEWKTLTEVYILYLDFEKKNPDWWK